MNRQEILRKVTEHQLRKDIPDFRPGDRVRVYYSVVEGDKRRIQPFEGDVIRIRRAGIATTFTVRKSSFGIGVERIFPLHSPLIQKIEILRRGRVRRAKLYYLRKLTGKKSKIPELKIYK